jgi:hypothetical protein
VDPLLRYATNRRVLLSMLTLLPALSGRTRRLAHWRRRPRRGRITLIERRGAKQAILDFVRTTTNRADPSHMPPEDQIAV